MSSVQRDAIGSGQALKNARETREGLLELDSKRKREFLLHAPRDRFSDDHGQTITVQPLREHGNFRGDGDRYDG
jgi:hypothetical protein